MEKIDQTLALNATTHSIVTGTSFIGGSVGNGYEYFIAYDANTDSANQLTVTIKLPDGHNIVHGLVLPLYVHVDRTKDATGSGTVTFSFKDFNNSTNAIRPLIATTIVGPTLKRHYFLSCLLLSDDRNVWSIYCPTLFTA